ncbi:hypothetical protein BDV33DRAFT_162511 [Aspergillus novoparasiticus]|uniref:Uncharacterized protein n=1 Tax=Aspergillus novoparasiticus TaxID=986946 RepID=A0A5N6F9T4_9EURO|nr:hypothetical protein BDV33DRAFT_162511 [Aspergillus novoparasiticus]
MRLSTRALTPYRPGRAFRLRSRISPNHSHPIRHRANILEFSGLTCTTTIQGPRCFVQARLWLRAYPFPCIPIAMLALSTGERGDLL